MKHTKPKTTVVLSFLGTLALVALGIACTQTLFDKDKGVEANAEPNFQNHEMYGIPDPEKPDCRTGYSSKKEAEAQMEVSKRAKENAGCIILYSGVTIDNVEFKGTYRYCIGYQCPKNNRRAGLALPLQLN